jgi:hypothetical protein
VRAICSILQNSREGIQGSDLKETHEKRSSIICIITHEEGKDGSKREATREKRPTKQWGRVITSIKILAAAAFAVRVDDLFQPASYLTSL